MDVELLTGLPNDQLLGVAASVALLLNHDEVAACASADLFESIVITVLYL